MTFVNFERATEVSPDAGWRTSRINDSKLHYDSILCHIEHEISGIQVTSDVVCKSSPRFYQVTS